MRGVFTIMLVLFCLTFTVGQERYTYIRFERFLKKMNIDSVYFAIECNENAVAYSRIHRTPIEVGRLTDYDYLDTLDSFIIPFRFRFIEGMIFSDSLIFTFYAELDSNENHPMIYFGFLNYLEDSVHLIVVNANYLKGEHIREHAVNILSPRRLIKNNHKFITRFRTLPLLNECQTSGLRFRKRRKK